MKRTEAEKKIREINHLNQRITFKILPTIASELSNLHRVHDQLQDRYRELVELSKKEIEE